MPKISHRAEIMPASPIRKLVPYSIAAKQKGIKVYHLNIGQPDIETPETALNALKDIHLKVLEYSLSEGNIEYREQLAKYYNRIGFEDLTPKNFIVTNGGSEALNFAISVLCDQDDEIIVPEPYYANYNGFSNALGVKVKSIPSSIETGFALPPIEEFEKKITDKTKAILICNPGNPTGYLYTREELAKLAEIALKHDVVVISDEVYREYVYDGKSQVSMLAFPELADNCIIIDSESKRYSMCGVRIGCMVTRSQKILDAAMKFAQARLSPVLIGQIIAAAAHVDDEAYIRSVREEYTKRRNLLVELLNGIPGVICPNPKGAFYCMVELPVKDTDDFAQWLLESYNYNGETIMVAPAGGFYSDPELGKKQVRMAYVLKEEDLRKSVEVLKHALQAYNG
ncbi:pyridoxal phosphate-dependent aminotransferase [Elizabethkingia meningoseptica]|uniref:Aspartate aminotransferase n=1 Tax=Elizabethkingia meningoseptica TaxID=238 RepID=A0A1V3U6L9_ELIME|nr:MULTISPECIES: pyridoxal phosphate-dependent aminotransferase [Elizabethkingia]AQX03810.1 aspartate aminotransferase [Elizabethkingia meningoseptica]AQX11269.1 aspartate aminotransferase [Elizabethkingia meningoseptica]AQX45849.1 aspartate aminotransferase [Elizabethkingia meningoseptica]EJK5329837.1 pyridoxal phosphate-dependent aminotransferase [Elizabethkingia meningoseptica]EOR30128.1 aspartate aminotransferase [Elizabethkingia meningoseptica ATCC 13253 = NBRC 12535]